jgi:hypothetical protein
MDKRHDEDTRAILARREEFVKRALSKDEISSVKGGDTCLIPQVCLKIVPDPCLTPQPCLTPINPIEEPVPNMD